MFTDPIFIDQHDLLIKTIMKILINIICVQKTIVL